MLTPETLQTRLGGWVGSFQGTAWSGVPGGAAAVVAEVMGAPQQLHSSLTHLLLIARSWAGARCRPGSEEAPGAPTRRGLQYTHWGFV